jgi:hypothetical protein
MRGRMGCGLLGVELMTDGLVLLSLLARQVVVGQPNCDRRHTGAPGGSSTWRYHVREQHLEFQKAPT